MNEISYVIGPSRPLTSIGEKIACLIHSLPITSGGLRLALCDLILPVRGFVQVAREVGKGRLRVS